MGRSRASIARRICSRRLRSRSTSASRRGLHWLLCRSRVSALDSAFATTCVSRSCIATLPLKAKRNVFIISSAWPFPRVEHFRILALARAIENQSYVIVANRVGTDGGVTFCGTSAIIDPYGVVVAVGLSRSRRTYRRRNLSGKSSIRARPDARLHGSPSRSLFEILGAFKSASSAPHRPVKVSTSSAASASASARARTSRRSFPRAAST